MQIVDVWLLFSWEAFIMEAQEMKYKLNNNFDLFYEKQLGLL